MSTSSDWYEHYQLFCDALFPRLEKFQQAIDTTSSAIMPRVSEIQQQLHRFLNDDGVKEFCGIFLLFLKELAGDPYLYEADDFAKELEDRGINVAIVGTLFFTSRRRHFFPIELDGDGTYLRYSQIKTILIEFDLAS